MTSAAPAHRSPRPLGAAVALALTLLACEPSRRVSPWGGAGPKLGLYVERPDLAGHLARVEEETRALELLRVGDLTVEDDRGETYVLAWFEGRDGVGARTTATRVATRHGVVVAVGPRREGDADAPTELVRALAAEDGAPIAFPRDANGDGTLEVLLRSSRGALALVSLSPRGSRTMEVAPPADGLELDGEGNVRFLRELGCLRATTATRVVVVAREPCAGAAGVLERPLSAPLSYVEGRFDRDASTEPAWHAARAAGAEQARADAAGLAADVLGLEAAFHRAMSTGAPARLEGEPAAVGADVLARAREDLDALVEKARAKR